MLLKVYIYEESQDRWDVDCKHDQWIERVKRNNRNDLYGMHEEANCLKYKEVEMMLQTS